MTHLLVTNDFPPKIGGIQSYLFEYWRRFDPDRFAVLTIDHPDAARFDSSVPFRVERLRLRMLLPTARVRHAVERLAEEIDAKLVIFDPALPVGVLGPSLSRPYGVILHGAELTVPARLPVVRGRLDAVLTKASLVITGGRYPASEARRLGGERLPVMFDAPPGVDSGRFRPLSADERHAARARFGIADDACAVVSVNRLVPRKGMDVLIEASARLAERHRELAVVVGGTGRDQDRLERLIRSTGAPARLVGFVPDADLPALYGCADVAALVCRTRWLGLEQEGFGIVLLEAAACGVVQLAGKSGGTEGAVVDGTTGLVVDRPADVQAVAHDLERLVGDPSLRRSLGQAARDRAVQAFNYDELARGLGGALAELGG